jgi:MioC protein
MHVGRRGKALMAADLTILVGTMTGTAELVAQELEDALTPRGVAVEVVPMDGLDETAFERESVFLICSSTYGQGDVPDNARDLFERLQAARPDLSAVRYGVIALGDRTYAATFCAGGRRFDALLAELGAVRIGEPLLHDASAGTVPEEAAVEWAQSWADVAGLARKAA